MNLIFQRRANVEPSSSTTRLCVITTEYRLDWETDLWWRWMLPLVASCPIPHLTPRLSVSFGEFE